MLGLSQLKPSVWVRPGMLLIFGAALDTALHSHHAIQLVLPMGNTGLRLGEREISQPLIINSLARHKLAMVAGWVLLIEPETDLGQILQSRLGDECIVISTDFEGTHIPEARVNDDPIKLLSPIFSALNMKRINYIKNQTLLACIKDRRIQQLLSELDQCFTNECKLLDDWHASVVAGNLALSESRFLHLFRDEMGIAWRPYLLWRRMICAVDAMVSGSNATNAAHLAGFSDSSHLSRTFRNQFGITIRQAQKLFA